MGLREERKRQRLSLEAVAYLGEVDIGTVSRVERGLTKPKPETVVKLSRALGLSVSRFRELLNADAAKSTSAGR